MATARLHLRPGRTPVWRVRWQINGQSNQRYFKAEADAEEFLTSLPRQTGRQLYADNGDRIRQNVSIDANGCWNWNLYKHRNEGYGCLTIGDRRLLAHRVSYEAFVGAIPPGLQIDHLCRNRACCNPEHLEAVTSSENNSRKPSTDRSV